MVQFPAINLNGLSSDRSSDGYPDGLISYEDTPVGVVRRQLDQLFNQLYGSEKGVKNVGKVHQGTIEELKFVILNDDTTLDVWLTGAESGDPILEKFR